MMHKCSSNTMGQCTCGLFQSQGTMLFSMPNGHCRSYDETDMYPLASSSSSVDCTLSLGTPSTRLSEDDERRSICHERRPSSCISNLRWDMLQNKSTPYSQQSYKNSSRGSNSSSNNSANIDTLVARRCANCDTTSTPLWRNGPKGPKSLCNACGIRFKKEERRATAAGAGSNNIGSASSGTTEHHCVYQNNSWIQTQKMPCLSPATEFRFIEDSNRDSDTGIPFLSWRLNVTDRPSLVHDFTR